MSGETTPAVDLAVVRRGWWIALARSCDHALVFIAQVLVARWIGPDEFGTFATALLVLTIIDGATESGISAALVHREDVEDRHLDVSWSIGIARGTVLGLGMFLAAPLIAHVADAPGAADMIRWIALVPLVRALASPGLVELERSLHYKRIAVCSLVESVAMFTVTLALVPVVDGAIALVAGILAGESARVVASYVLAPRKPRLHVERAASRELFHYGRWVTGSSIALLLLLYMDDVAVAALLGAGALAVYQLAYQVAGVPASEISLVVGQVAFTSMSRLRSDAEKLARTFLQTYELVAVLSVPIAVGLVVLADPLIDALLGPQWSDAAPVIQVLAAWGVLRALGSLTTATFRAVGRPEIAARHHWAMVGVTAVFLVPMVELFGIVGAAVAVLVPNIVIHWFRYRDVAAVVDVTTAAIRGRLVAPAIAGGVMAVVMASTRLASDTAGPWWTLAAAALAGCAAYVVTLLLFERRGRCDALHAGRRLVVGAR